MEPRIPQCSGQRSGVEGLMDYWQIVTRTALRRNNLGLSNDLVMTAHKRGGVSSTKHTSLDQPLIIQHIMAYSTTER